MENKVKEILAPYFDLPRFPDGRIDYSQSSSAPVLNIAVISRGKLLLLKRSDKVRAYKNLWNTIGGYIDEVVPLRKKVLAELREELSIKEHPSKMIIFPALEQVDEEHDFTWKIVPVLVEFSSPPEIRLDWEHSEYRWIDPVALDSYQTIPGLSALWEKK